MFDKFAEWEIFLKVLMTSKGTEDKYEILTGNANS